jgi:hypothetical protein
MIAFLSKYRGHKLLETESAIPAGTNSVFLSDTQALAPSTMRLMTDHLSVFEVELSWPQK